VLQISILFFQLWKDDVIDLTQSPRSKDDEVEIIKSHPAVSNLIVGRPLPVVQVMEKMITVRILLSQKQEEISTSEIQELKKDEKCLFLTESIGRKFFLNIWKK
jgi:hypothetical protein